MTSKTFVLDHPLKPDKYLVHACLEGPEAGVYYRGEGVLSWSWRSFFFDSETTVTLPEYTQELASNWTVYVSVIDEDSWFYARSVRATRVKNGSFTVRGTPGSFSWYVVGTRERLLTEPPKETTPVYGVGPYKYVSTW